MIPTLEFRRRLRELAACHGAGMDEAREELEGRLSPLVRVALRKGVGAPDFVNWVRTALARLMDGANVEPADQFAPQITRLLCAELMRGRRAALVTTDARKTFASI